MPVSCTFRSKYLQLYGTASHRFHLSRRLTFFGHRTRMDENADAGQTTFELPLENWSLL